jgi:hypothetical protein
VLLVVVRAFFALHGNGVEPFYAARACDARGAAAGEGEGGAIVGVVLAGGGVGEEGDVGG